MRFPDSVTHCGSQSEEALADNDFVVSSSCPLSQLLNGEGRWGTARDNINTWNIRESDSFPFQAVGVQKEIVFAAETPGCETQRLESIYQHKLIALDELKKSLLHQAFSGQL